MIEPSQNATQPEPRDKIGQKLFRTCAERLDAKPLVARIAEIGQIDESADELRGLILRCGSLRT